MCLERSRWLQRWPPRLGSTYDDWQGEVHVDLRIEGYAEILKYVYLTDANGLSEQLHNILIELP